MYKNTLYFHDYQEAKSKRIEVLRDKDNVVNAFLSVYKESPIEAYDKVSNKYEKFEYVLDIYYRD